LVVQRIRGIKGYAPIFAAAFGDSTISFERIAQAIATFERTVASGNSPYDRYLAGDKSALTKQQKDGLDFLNKKGECA
jgi:cytochrome c peroxidase